MTADQDPKNMKDLDRNRDHVIQICENRWTEGIYDIVVSDFACHQVRINQSDVPDLATP